MTTVRAVGVGGTWSWRGGWWQRDSLFWTFMGAYGIEQTFPRVDTVNGRTVPIARPFEWETGLGDSIKFWRSSETRVRTWVQWGKALGYYLDSIPYYDRNVIAHSHGGQLALVCATIGVRLHRLLTIATPRREDMDEFARGAALNIGSWHHVCDRDSDRIGWWGAFGDGHFGNSRIHPHAHQNICIPKISHSRLLSDPQAFHVWNDEGLISFLRSSDGRRVA